MARFPTSIEREIGRKAAAQVIAIAGGELLHVPGRRQNSAALVARFGDELAAILIEHFGDSRFYVPRAKVSKPVDDADIAALGEENHSAAYIARMLGCSIRTVHKSRARYKSNAGRYVMGRLRTANYRHGGSKDWLYKKYTSIRSSACDEWKDYEYFRDFFSEMKEGQRLYRIDASMPWGPENYKIVAALSARSTETTS